MVASKRPVSLPDKILILILIDLSWVIIGSIFRSATLGGSIFSKLSLSPFILLLLPFIYLYVKKSISEQPALYKNELKHFIIPLIFVLAGIVYEPLYILENEMHNNPKFNLVMVLNPILSVIYAAYYLSLTYKLIQIHQKRIPDHFSYTSSKITLNWVKIVMILFIINWVLTGVILTLNIYVEKQVVNAGMVFFINVAIFSFAISYFGFLQPAIFQSRKLLEETIELVEDNKQAENTSKQKYQKSTLSKEMGKSVV